MKTSYLTILLWLLVSAAVCEAQDAKMPSGLTDFSGRWVSETVKVSSDSGRLPRTTDSNLKIEMVIAQSRNELRVKETTVGNGKFSRDTVYYLDGRGESNKGFTDSFIYESKTSLKDKKLLIEGAILAPNSRGSSFQTEEEWELSADGKTLTIKTKTSGRSVIRHEKVFRLAS